MKKSTFYTVEAALAAFVFLPNGIVSIRYILERDIIDPSSTIWAGAGLFFLVLFGLMAIEAHRNGQ